MSRAGQNKTLGMPHGTACGRLKKMILFNLLGRLKEDICFKCDKQITKLEELSIEHKKPWEGRSAELFWDLNNIAFSHLACNRPDNPGTRKIKVPEGMAWCSRHKAALPIIEFQKCSRNDDGVQRYCRVCKAETDKRANHAKIK